MQAQMRLEAGQLGEPAAPQPQAGSLCAALQQYAHSINGNVHHNHDALALCFVSLKALSHSAPTQAKHRIRAAAFCRPARGAISPTP